MKDDTLRVGRGGPWGYTPQYARVAARSWLPPVSRVYDLGLRLARDPIHRLAKAAQDEG